ncbi:MAG: HAD family hydrolase [Bacteroidota bacterium]
MNRSPVIYVDVDDTFVRSASHARIPMPEVIQAIQRLHQNGATLYCWSSGGGDYARSSAREFGIEECFEAFLPKPDVLLDDVAVSDWRRLRYIHPSDVAALNRIPNPSDVSS